MTMETCENAYHIRVARSCSSCQHKEILNDGTRICQLTNMNVPQSKVCPQWQMSDGLKNAGMSGGVIKKLTEIIIR